MDQYKDVTAIVAKLVSSGNSWCVNNGEMQGDPCPGVGPKKLKLTLEHEGRMVDCVHLGIHHLLSASSCGMLTASSL